MTFGLAEFSLSLEQEEDLGESCRGSDSCLDLLALLEGVYHDNLCLGLTLPQAQTERTI